MQNTEKEIEEFIKAVFPLANVFAPNAKKEPCNCGKNCNCSSHKEVISSCLSSQMIVNSDEREIVVSLLAAGYSKEEIKLSIKERILYLVADKKDAPFCAKGLNYSIDLSKYSGSLSTPSARLENGIMTVRIPRKENRSWEIKID